MEVILKEMFQRVGAEYAWPEGGNWFMEHSWTEEEQASFEVWLTDYMMNNPEARRTLSTWTTKNKRMMKKFAKDFTFMWGWKLQ